MNALDLAYLPVALAYAPSLLRKRRGGWRERFGRIEPLPPKARPRLLIHAVSVGETASLRWLIPRLTPEVDVVVSVTTDTGIERARALYGPMCRVVRYPLDLSASVRRFFEAVNPDAVALVELELWPNFLREAKRRGVPVGVIGGRLSERSFAGYSRFRRFVGGMFRSLEFAAVQDAAYAARFEAMGVPAGRCLITGSMKWDAVAPGGGSGGPGDGARKLRDELGDELGIDPTRPLIVAGSTAEGEEALLHTATPAGVQLLCAPRKPERFNEAASALPGCVRRSAGARAPDGTDRFLLDTIGELGRAYELADVVVMGRTFVPLGGSDPIEPIALGRAVVVGPHVDNFRTVVDALDAERAIVRADRAGLAGALSRLLRDEGERRRLATAGLTCIEKHRGASARHAELLLSLLGVGGVPAGAGRYDQPRDRIGPGPLGERSGG
jgi:3-deoxy-D-manno-octulosonic-acid transferase